MLAVVVRSYCGADGCVMMLPDADGCCWTSQQGEDRANYVTAQLVPGPELCNKTFINKHMAAIMSFTAQVEISFAIFLQTWHN